MAFVGKKFFGGDPLRLPDNYGVYGATEFQYWPKCFRCMERRNFQTRVPVEAYGAWDHPARSLGCKKTVEIYCKCHGKKQGALIDVPYMWTEEIERIAISRLVFFGPEKPEAQNPLGDK